MSAAQPTALMPAQSPAGSPRSPAAERDRTQALDALEDGALMLRYRAGEVEAFRILYERHKGALYRYLQRMCRSRETANDLFQEVWGKMIASRERYEVRAQFATFLFRIAHNCAVDHFRRAQRRQAVRVVNPAEVEEALPAGDQALPERQLAALEARAAFRRALEALPAEQRDVFLLYEETGLGLEEIGRITGVGMETAKSRLRYAVAKLRAALGEHEPARIES